MLGRSSTSRLSAGHQLRPPAPVPVHRRSSESRRTGGVLKNDTGESLDSHLRRATSNGMQQQRQIKPRAVAVKG